MKNNKILTALYGLVIGLINGLLGAGGGMLAVPLLKKFGFTQKAAQQNTIAIILPITTVSSIMYILNDYVNLFDGLIYLPTGLIGAVVATFLMKKFSNKWLKKIFAFFMLYAGIRLLLK